MGKSSIMGREKQLCAGNKTREGGGNRLEVSVRSGRKALSEGEGPMQQML